MENNITRFIDNEVKTTVINIGTEEAPYEIEVKSNQPRTFLNAMINAILGYFEGQLDDDAFVSYESLETITAAAIFDQFTNMGINDIDEVGYILDQTDVLDKVINAMGREHYDYILEGVMEGRNHILKTREFEVNIEKLFKPAVDALEALREWSKDVDLKEVSKAFNGLDDPKAVNDSVVKYILDNEDK